MNKHAWDQLGDRRCFILARVEPKAGGGTNKLPTDPNTGGNISAHDETQWLTAAEASMWAGVWGKGYGVGIVIAEGSGLWCLDIDHCRDGAAWAPFASNFISRFPGAYVEVSVSGQGIHVIGSTTAPPAHGTRNATYRCELYTKARFIYLGTQGAGSILTDCTDALSAFAALFFPEHEHGIDAGEWRTEPVSAWRGPDDDDELIARALRSSSANAVFIGRASFRDLWTANTDVLSKVFPPQGEGEYDGSGADQALCNHLSFWAGGNHERVAALLRKSGLARPKHDREDYIRKTVSRACTDQREWYKGPGDPPPVVVDVPIVSAGTTPTAAAAPTPPDSIPKPSIKPLDYLPATQAAHAFTLDGKNKYEASLSNIATRLASNEFVQLGFDTFFDRIVIGGPGGVGMHALTDDDVTRVRMALERQNFASIPANIMRDALTKVAKDNSFDSAIVWLNGLVWDGVPRIDRFLHTHCGAVDDDYTRAVGRYIWTGLPARVFEAGCQLDMVVAFQSKQGTRKSSGFMALAPAPEYFTDNLSLTKDGPDFKRAIRGKIIVEIAELAGLGKAEVELVKSMITRRVEEWVEKWEKFLTRYPRRCMLFASTNKEQFLPEDPTGQRRWLPVEIAKLNDVLITADREQLWAEGAARWGQLKNAGLPGVDFHDAERLAAGRHAQYEQTDVWEDKIATWLDRELEGQAGQILRPAPRTRPYLQISEVLEGAINMATDRMDPRAASRAANALRHQGYERARVPINGKRVWCYVPKSAP